MTSGRQGYDDSRIRREIRSAKDTADTALALARKLEAAAAKPAVNVVPAPSQVVQQTAPRYTNTDTLASTLAASLTAPEIAALVDLAKIVNDTNVLLQNATVFKRSR